MIVKKERFGLLSSGDEVSLFTVSNGTMSFSASNYGCCITGILLPAANGGHDDVVLGYSTLEGYLQNKPHFGSIIGRCAGRIANAEFSLEGKRYALTRNSHGLHCLHGGYPFYDKQLWTAEPFDNASESGIRFFRISRDGEQGFPGEVRITVTYSLTHDNAVVLRYEASTTKTTPINLTNHSYFNLNPAGMQDDGGYVSALNHHVQIFSDQYVEINDALLPTGSFIPVAGTPFDFRSSKPLMQDFAMLKNGYDGTWLLRKNNEQPVPLVAAVSEPVSGRALHIYSTQPALTMYTANFLNGERGKNGDVYNKHSAVCFETQHVPDSPNHPEFPPVWITPDKTYRHETRWQFSGNF